MKMYFILFSDQLDESKQVATKQLIIQHGGLSVGEHLIINDLSFKEVLRILKLAPYNVVCEEQQSTKIMKLGNKRPRPPKDPFVRHSELKKILKEELTPFVTHEELKTTLNEALKPFVTHEELKATLNEALKPFVTHEELKAALTPIEKSLADIASALVILNLRLDQNGLKPYVKPQN